MLELAFPDGSCKFFKEISFQHVFLLTMPYGMWHLSSSTRDHTHNLCIGNGESLPLGCQGNPLFFFFFFFLNDGLHLNRGAPEHSLNRGHNPNKSVYPSPLSLSAYILFYLPMYAPQGVPSTSSRTWSKNFSCDLLLNSWLTTQHQMFHLTNVNLTKS